MEGAGRDALVAAPFRGPVPSLDRKGLRVHNTAIGGPPRQPDRQDLGKRPLAFGMGQLLRHAKPKASGSGNRAELLQQIGLHNGWAACRQEHRA